MAAPPRREKPSIGRVVTALATRAADERQDPTCRAPRPVDDRAVHTRGREVRAPQVHAESRGRYERPKRIVRRAAGGSICAHGRGE
eukprot:scaffold219017_cov35-Tisochrysis_lutea.AAC.1